MCSFNPNTTDYYLCRGPHVHELIGSTLVSETCDCCHNHRFAAVTSDAIPAQGSHYHTVTFQTDSFDCHWHSYSGPTTLAIPTGDGRHIHFLNGTVCQSNEHEHLFCAATLINDPTTLY